MAKRKTSKAELGGGVSSLLGNRRSPVRAADGEINFVMLPIGKIERNIDQPRLTFEETALNELADSIKEHGIIQPITVRNLKDGNYQIISGERRWKASQIAGLKEIPCYVRVVNPEELLEMGIIENIQREDLNPWEMVESLNNLKKLYKDNHNIELTNAEIGKKIGKKGNTITGYLSIMRLPENIKNALQNGAISMGHAKALAGLEDGKSMQNFYTKVSEEDWSVRVLEKAIKDHKEETGTQKIKTPKATLPTEFEVVERKLKDIFGSGKISIKLKGDGKGQITLPFNSTDEFNRFLDVIEGE